MDVLLFYLNLFIFCHAGSSLRRRHSSSCVERRPLEPCWVGFSGCFPLVGGAGGALPSCGRGFSGCCPLVGGAGGGAALLWAGLLGVLSSCGWGFLGCCPLVGWCLSRCCPLAGGTARVLPSFGAGLSGAQASALSAGGSVGAISGL